MRSSLSGILAFILAVGLFVALSYAPPDGFADADSTDTAEPPPKPETLSTTRVGARAEPREPVTFATLGGDQQIVVRYESTGCFHHARYRMTFRNEAGLAVEVAKVDDAGAETVLGNTRLGAAQAAKLDNLIAFYRTLKGEGASTTQDDIEFETREGGRTVTSEKFHDGTDLTITSPDLISVEAFVNELGARHHAAKE